MAITQETGALIFVQKIVRAQYTFPSDVPLSPICIDLIKRIFVPDPNQRISLQDIKRHPWFMMKVRVNVRTIVAGSRLRLCLPIHIVHNCASGHSCLGSFKATASNT